MSEIPEVTYTVTPITDRYISRFLYTLYKYSKPNSFRVVVVDQTKDGFSPQVMNYVRPLIHLYMHPIRNLGYAKAHNEALIHGLHWKTPLICLANDDIEIINSRWMDGIYRTFEKDERIKGVIPMSPRVAGWGYGVNYYPEILPYKEEYTEEDYNYLIDGNFEDNPARLPATYPRHTTGIVVDGAVFVMPYFKRDLFEEVGLLDERFFPGSGEDVDFCARAYIKSYRIVSTSFSWIWHHWSRSKDLFASGELEDEYYKPKLKPYWNNHGDLWPKGFDVWGKDKEGKPYPRVSEVFTDQI